MQIESIIIGFFIAILNFLLSLASIFYAMKFKPEKSISVFLALLPIRFIITIVLCLYIYNSKYLDNNYFMGTVFVFYFIFLIVEILCLNSKNFFLNLRDIKLHKRKK